MKAHIKTFSILLLILYGTVIQSRSNIESIKDHSTGVSWKNLISMNTHIPLIYGGNKIGDRNILNAGGSTMVNPSMILAVPVISSITPASQTVVQNETPTTITVTATGALSYKWYSNTINSNSGGTLIGGSTSASYIPSTTIQGSKYYYVVAINGADTATSNAVNVTVANPCSYGASTNGTPTATDSDGDGINNVCDLDDDNDGILDTNECYVGPKTITNTDVTMATLLAGGTVTVNGVNITVSKVNRAETFTTDGCLENGVWLNRDYDTSSSSITINFSKPITYFTTTFGAQQTEERITFSQPATSTEVFMNCTYGINGNSPIISNVSLMDGGTRLQSNLTGDGGLTPADFGSNSRVHWNFASPVTSLTITNTGSFVSGGWGGNTSTNFNGTIVGGAFSFITKAETCDTDGDGIPDYLDTDSDNDGCPDATEGANHYTTTATLTGGSNGGSSGNLGTTVNANGIPIPPGIVGGSTGQTTTSDVLIPVKINAGTTPPATVSANIGATVNLTSNATAESATTWATTTPFAPNYSTLGNATSGLIYSWTKNGVAISGATSATLTLTSLTAASAGTYVVTIKHSGNYCATTSTATILTITNPVCYDNPNNGAGELPSNHGITTLQRAGAEVSNGNWPMVRTGAWTVLESKTKGFVITRVATANLGLITSPQEGMMVYDTTANCLKIYSDSTWKCFETPACP